jgi:tetratricopeptide (TPR) repeat protein
MILGCADWARAGAIAPVPARLLRDLAAPHLSARQLARANDEDYDEALRWATREINPTVSLLQPELGQRYSVFTFALDLLSDRGDPIPDPSWLIVVDNAEAGDLIEIARAAARDRRPDITERALNLCEQRGEPGSAPLAAMYLGSVLNKRGERAEAKAAYHRAIASDHTDAKPAALIGLAVLLTEEGATGEAEQAYRQAILTNHGVLWPAAALHLGLLLAEAGDLDRAEEAFRELIDHPLNLELTMAKMRREAEANGVPVIFAFVDARARQPTPDVFLEAELCLAGVLVTKNDFEGAKQIYADLERAQPEWIRGVALSQLSSLLLTEGKDLARAQLCSERALPLVTGPLEAKVRGDLALIHSVRGDHATAEAYFVEAMEMGFPEVAVVAAYSLADFRLQRGDTEGAQEAIRLMNEYGSHEDGAPVLARLTESGTPPEARTD